MQWPDATTCGVDEAGRGPLAGPVFAAAVLLDPDHPFPGIRDSKAMSATARDLLAATIRERAIAWSVAEASVEEIDRLNILQATLLAMRRAVEILVPAARAALIDGNRLPLLAIPATTVVKGDSKVAAIAAASILAKTARDARMMSLHADHPEFGFDRHMGYPTAAHFEAIERFGVTPHHRRSFAPVRRALAGESIRAS
ncbi:MAG TPA: ribonuclease HII [Rhodocyclaceae bacterium]